MSQEFAYILQTLLEESRLKDYPAMRADKYFEIFSAQQALKARKFNPDKDEIESGIVGGGGDGGVDGFYLSVNRHVVREDTDPVLFKGQQVHMELVIIQAKNKPSFEEIVPTKLTDFADNCLRLNADITSEARHTLYSEALLTLVKKFHDIYRQSLTTKLSRL